jgi:hypothetical protein
LIETTSRSGRPGVRDAIASGVGCMGIPFAVGPWPVIVTR